MRALSRLATVTAIAVAASLLVSSCVKNPVTGKKELVLVSESQEVAMGREAAASVDSEMGLYPDEELQAYVERVGIAMASASERPDLPWRFRVVDSSVVNAFALPGGYIYLTRGILSYINDEAALAGVTGHEIGHVTARHSVQQISRQQLAGLGLGLGTVFFPEVRPFGDLLGTGLGLLFLKFGRDDEREADRLGVRYSLAEGYDPTEMAEFFSVLKRLSGEERDIPAWASTHPDPEEREAKIREMVKETAVSTERLEVGEERYKQSIEGLVFGENPREGFVRGRRFLHPDLKFQLEFPEGWSVRNSRQAVYSAPRDGAAALQLTAAGLPEGTTPEAHARAFFARNNLEYSTGERIRVGPFSAYRAPFRAFTQSGEVVGEAGFIADGARIFQIIGFTYAGSYRQYSPVFRQVILSFDRLRDKSALDIQPLRVKLYRVPESMSFSEAMERSGTDPEHREELTLLNDLSAGDALPTGKLVKILQRGPS